MGNTFVAEANVVEHGQSSNVKKKYSSKGSKMRLKCGFSKKLKFQFQGKCYNCEKTGHCALEMSSVTEEIQEES